MSKPEACWVLKATPVHDNLCGASKIFMLYGKGILLGVSLLGGTESMLGVEKQYLVTYQTVA